MVGMRSFEEFDVLAFEAATAARDESAMGHGLP